MEPFLLGFDRYTVRPGNTIWSIAHAYGTTVEAILSANPGVDPEKLTVGTQLVIPYNFPVVDTNIDYTYAVLERDIAGLKARYPFLETSSAGRSVLGKNLYTIKLGTGPNEVFYNGPPSLGVITTPVLKKFNEALPMPIPAGRRLGRVRPRRHLESLKSLFYPDGTPGGVDLE
jgi:g-D-glutamyl-meso-diaminopimelate peptidase